MTLRDETGRNVLAADVQVITRGVSQHLMSEELDTPRDKAV